MTRLNVIPGRRRRAPEGKGIQEQLWSGEVVWIPFPALRAAGDDRELAWRAVSSDTPVVERYAVYILASRRNGTLYIGVTSALPQRVAQHKARAVPGFTQQYGVTTLVYVERYANIYDAIAREKQLKGWNRAWKIKLIEAGNPNWDELDPTAC